MQADRLVPLTHTSGASSVLDMELADAQIEALQQADLRYREARAILDNAKVLREREIRRVAAEGAPYRAIGAASGVSYQRVAQIVTGKEPPKMSIHATLEVACPRCPAEPGERCEGAQGMFHGERHDVRLAAFLDEHPELR